MTSMKNSIIKKTATAMGAIAVLLATANPQAQVIMSPGGGGSGGAKDGQSAVIMAPSANTQGNMRAELNMAGDRVASVSIVRTGDRMHRNANLRILDANYNLVRRLTVSDRGPTARRDERVVGTWDLTDVTGRRVRAGTYTIIGTVRTVGGRDEEVDLTFTVRGRRGGTPSDTRVRPDGRNRREFHAPDAVPATPAPAEVQVIEQVIEVVEPVEQQVIEAVPLPATLTPEEVEAVATPIEPEAEVEQTPPDPEAQLREDRDRFMERLDEAVGNTNTESAE